MLQLLSYKSVFTSLTHNASITKVNYRTKIWFLPKKSCVTLNWAPLRLLSQHTRASHGSLHNIYITGVMLAAQHRHQQTSRIALLSNIDNVVYFTATPTYETFTFTMTPSFIDILQGDITITALLFY